MTANQPIEVLDEGHPVWIFFTDGDQYFIDVFCNHGAIGFGVTIALNEEELALYRLQGRAYLNQLGDQIHDSLPLLSKTSPYTERNVPTPCSHEVFMEALDRFRNRDRG